MDERNERLRNAGDGSDISLTQAQVWTDLGAALAGILRRVCGVRGASAEEQPDSVPADSQAGPGRSSDREAA